MNERLVIRLASEANQKIDWLVWSDAESEIIASGEVKDAKNLLLLQPQAEQRLVVCLLPSADVLTQPVVIAGHFNRQLQQALPYLLEDDLASDVDLLHFNVFHKKKDLIHVALCAQSKMLMWLSWLADANIVCRQFIPETLALPFSDDQWHAVKKDNRWLVRENEYIAWGCEAEILPIILTSKIEAYNADIDTESNDQKHGPVIHSYSELTEQFDGDWRDPEIVLTMEVLAKGSIGNSINMLSGEFKPKKESNPQLQRWRKIAISAGVLFAFFVVNIYVQTLDQEKQTESVKVQIEDLYQQALPDSPHLKYARIKKKIKTLIQTSGQKNNEDFIVFLDEVAQHFIKNNELIMENVKYKRSRGELNILAVGKSFRSFEVFAEKLPKSLSLSQGALNNRSDGVTGLLTIRKK